MSSSMIIPNRLNWIDWAKTLAISFVVFGHIPEKSGSFLVCYITQFHMPLFFFISGFLTKTEYLNKETIKKYWHTLIIPYLCYNILFYPYWITRHIIESKIIYWYDFIKPLIGTLMLQHSTQYYESLNGVTWFISALLIMRVLLAASHKYRLGHVFIFLGATVCAITFIYNEFERLVIDLPFVGFIRCFPFFILGHICKKHHVIDNKTKNNKDIMMFVFGVGISLYTFIIGFNDMTSYGIYFWIINLSAIAGVLGGCRLLDSISLKIIQNISVGTITIMGVHWMFIGVTNFLLEKALGLVRGITYPWYYAIIITIFIISFIYPIIILFKTKYHFMLGKKH